MKRGTKKGQSRRAWTKYKPAILLAAVLPLRAAAADILWTNPLGGDFQTGGNWLGGTPPGTGDVANFSLNNPYTVTFSTGAVTDGLVAHGGTVTLNLGGFS